MKITFSDFSNYQLGLFWGIASYADDRVLFRNKERYYLDCMRNVLNNKVYKQHSREKEQYVLKSGMIDIETFISNNWTDRNSKIREVPNLKNYKDFLRGYIELHSTLDYSTRYKCNRKVKYKALRLRIYGNWKLIEDINNIISAEVPTVAPKTPQSACNDITKILYYHSFIEIKDILEYIYDDECFEKYWEDVKIKFENPIID